MITAVSLMITGILLAARVLRVQARRTHAPACECLACVNLAVCQDQAIALSIRCRDR